MPRSPWVTYDKSNDGWRGALKRLRRRSALVRLTYWPTRAPERSRWKSVLAETLVWIVVALVVWRVVWWGFRA
jgi:hypothetical protein